jgi:hypothetical protein
MVRQLHTLMQVGLTAHAGANPVHGAATKIFVLDSRLQAMPVAAAGYAAMFC